MPHIRRLSRSSWIAVLSQSSLSVETPSPAHRVHKTVFWLLLIYSRLRTLRLRGFVGRGLPGFRASTGGGAVFNPIRFPAPSSL